MAVRVSLERSGIQISPIDDPPFLHDELDAAQGLNVGDRVTIEEDKVGEFPW